MSKKTMLERFEEKYDKKDNGCWEWSASMHDRGYGYFYTSREFSKRKMDYAHRVALYLYNGLELKSTDEVCHKCDNTRCVNPDHLVVADHTYNMKDMIGKKRWRVNQKLSKSDVELAIFMREEGAMLKDIAKHFECDEGHCSRITRGHRKYFNEDTNK